MVYNAYSQFAHDRDNWLLIIELIDPLSHFHGPLIMVIMTLVHVNWGRMGL